MATYPNLPGGFIYDLGRDGTQTQMKGSTGTFLSSVSEGGMDAMIGWNTGTKGVSIPAQSYMVCLFPQARSVEAIAMNGRCTNNDTTATLAYSLDTVDGVNGQWTTVKNLVCYNAFHSANELRTSIWPVGASGIKAVRIYTSYFNGNLDMELFGVWGTTLSNGLTPWHPTLDQALSNDTGSLDRGDILVTAAPVVQQFRVKNNSTTHNATTVVIQADTTSAAGALDTELLFSLDNVNFQSSQTISAINIGTVSPLIYMKRPTPTNPAGTTRIATVKATAGAWAVP